MMIIYEIWTNTQEPTKFQFKSFDEAKHYGQTHFYEFYIQPKFINDDETYFARRKKNVGKN